MPFKLTWDDAEDIGIALYEKHPDVDPLSLSFPTMHKRILELEDFDDDPEGSNEGKLEAVQMAWLEEWKANQA